MGTQPDPFEVQPVQLHCPACGSEELTTIETTIGTGHFGDEGLRLHADDTIEALPYDTRNDHTETTGVQCGCGWSHEGPDWRHHLSRGALHPATMACLRDLAGQFATAGGLFDLDGDAIGSIRPNRLVTGHLAENYSPHPGVILAAGEPVMVEQPAEGDQILAAMFSFRVGVCTPRTGGWPTRHLVVLDQLPDPDDDWAEDDADWVGIDTTTADRRHVEDLIRTFRSWSTPALTLARVLMVFEGWAHSPAYWAAMSTLAWRHGGAKPPTYGMFTEGRSARPPRRVTVTSSRPADA